MPGAAVRGVEHLHKLLPAMANRAVGERIDFPGFVEIASRSYSSAIVEHDFKTASGARLLRFLPGGTHFVFKLGDVQQEVAAMCTFREMNQRWGRSNVKACGVVVEVVTYDIIPLGSEAGLVEVVTGSRTMRELAHDCVNEERQFRVLRALREDPARLDKLAATTVAYLTAGYALGIRDSHDDNIMLRDDGSFFRVDFGYIFGAAPSLDAPPLSIPRAVLVALGESRWREVVSVCELALVALSGDLRQEPPAWACIRSVPEMAPVANDALTYVRSLSLEAFRAEVSVAHEWSLTRAAKNRLREMVRYLRDPEALSPSAETPQNFQGRPLHPGGAAASWRFSQPEGDEAPLSEDEEVGEFSRHAPESRQPVLLSSHAPFLHFDMPNKVLQNAAEEIAALGNVKFKVTL